LTRHGERTFNHDTGKASEEIELRRALLLVLGLLSSHAATAQAATPAARCMAMIAVLEAAGEGEAGMAAVIEVVKNRAADPRFPDEACAVVAQDRQFQPVGEWPALKRALAQPAALDPHAMLAGGPARRSLDRAFRLVSAGPSSLTGGALYFVNPRAMDPRHCDWFAGLKRTAEIGNHVFMTHYRKGELRAAPALDCSDPMIGSLLNAKSSLARQYAQGLFHPDGPRIASRTPTPAELKAWRRTGRLDARAAELKKHFKPGWISLE
jgi:hypothetical protein